MSEDFTVKDKRALNGEGEPKEEVTPEPEKPSLISQLIGQDILAPFINQGLLGTRYMVSKEGDKIVSLPYVLRALQFKSPWCYVNNDLERRCQWRQDIEACFGFIPRQCMACWKVVVVPRTLKELLILHKVQKVMVSKDPHCWCKCGVEIRPDVERNYGGYFYTNSKEEGLRRLREVRKLVHANIAPDVPVFLKRSCTEFERKYGDSDQWDQKRAVNADQIEQQIKEHSTIEHEGTDQNMLVENHVVAGWIKFAAERGDPTVRELNNGKPLYPDYVKYEEE
jgi:hypothetical protein